MHNKWNLSFTLFEYCGQLKLNVVSFSVFNVWLLLLFCRHLVKALQHDIVNPRLLHFKIESHKD